MMTVYVSDYISKSTDDIGAIKKCLSDVEDNDSRVIVFDKKDWEVTEAIVIKSNTHIIIDNCSVKLADYTFDNIFRGVNIVIDEANPYGLPKECSKLSNIKIEGKGNAQISGPNINKSGYHSVLCEEQLMVGDFWGWRTHLISISNCIGFEISGLAITNTCGWAMSFDMCHNGYIHDIRFNTDVKNGDGIDFRSGCSNCRVENIYGTTSDDTVACTALFNENETYPFKNYLYPNEPSSCIKNRTDTERDISNITIKNIETCGMHHSVICLAANQNRVYNIQIENVKEADCDKWREATVKIYTGYGGGYKKGDIHNITVRNVSASYAEHAVYCNTEVENVYLENIVHKIKGGETKLDFPSGICLKE